MQGNELLAFYTCQPFVFKAARVGREKTAPLPFFGERALVFFPVGLPTSGDGSSGWERLS